MEPNETMVENEDLDTEVDDTLPEEVVEEETDESEDLADFTDSEEEPAEEKPEPAKTQGTSEPGWIKKRVGEAVDKALARQRLEMQAEREAIRAEYEAKYAPLMERMLEMDAQELVRTHKVGDIETARELVRLRNNQPAPAPKVEQPRQANGQFAPKEDPATSARIDMLKHQAARIKENSKIDVLKEFSENEEIKMKVIKGEMDFYDVADYMRKQKPSKRPPSPMRSPNGASGHNPNAIETMSDEQFARMEKRISEGARIRLS